MTSTRRGRQGLRALGLAACAATLVTCGVMVPREGWSKRWGPLVPHETFPADCSLCHVPERWDTLRDDFSFDHEKETGVALEGAHAQAACLRCHNDFGPVEAYATRGCAGCHLDPHRAQLGGDCLQCHTQDTWQPTGLVAEHARTRFPLVGRHAVVACSLCHVRAPTGDYRGAPRRCEQCHQEDLARALNPDHRANGWTTSCERCHQPTGWAGADFSHDFFPLTGGHALNDCSRCHTGGRFDGLSRDCLSCHADDRARAPGHDAFPTRCEQCHTTARWEGAVFNHRFPLRGEHDVDCSVCHTTPNTRVFSCFACHEHRRSETDDEHDDVQGYRYDSAACFQCHPTGED